MTTNQITKRLTKNNFSLEGLTIERDMIEVAVGYQEKHGFGSVDNKKTKALANKIKKIFPECSYTSGTGYGAIVIWINYSKNPLVSQNID